MEVTFRATEIGSYEERGRLLCGASNFKDPTAEYHFITLGHALADGKSIAKEAPLEIEFDGATAHPYNVTSCLVSPTAWRLSLRQSSGAETLSVLVLHDMTAETYRQFVQSLGALFSGRPDDLHVGDRI